MATLGWDTNPDNNTSINGTDISENCPSENMNNAVREVMAALETFAQTLPDTSALMPQAGGTFSGTQPVYTGRGAMMHNNDPGAASGRVFRQPTGGSVPAGMVNGDWLIEYTP